jgi:hypothetical protein
MRRNLTISFDEEFIQAMDRERRDHDLSRGKWLEECWMPGSTQAKAIKYSQDSAESRADVFRRATQKRMR